jgi:hypothetical protein
MAERGELDELDGLDGAVAQFLRQYLEAEPVGVSP